MFLRILRILNYLQYTFKIYWIVKTQISPNVFKCPNKFYICPSLASIVINNLIRHGNLVDTRKLFQNWFHDFRVVIGTPRLFSGSQLVTKSNSVGDIRRRRMLVPGLYFWGPYRVTALGHPDCTLNLFGPFWNPLRYAGIFADIVWVMVLQRRILLGPIFPLRFARDSYTRRHT